MTQVYCPMHNTLHTFPLNGVDIKPALSFVEYMLSLSPEENHARAVYIMDSRLLKRPKNIEETINILPQFKNKVRQRTIKEGSMKGWYDENIIDF